MSGIIGLLHLDGQPVDPLWMKRMTDYLSYLGPDERGAWVKERVGLGHAMLRTTYESENEHQPLTLDGKTCITADARIDARDDLIRSLKSKGCRIAGDAPDAELILHAYQEWGDECVTRLLGDFSFIIWDGRKERLFCARDHFGLRSLFYAHSERSLVLSNTLSGARRHPDVADSLDDRAVGDFLLFGSHAWLDKSLTIFSAIRRVPPAHVLIWNGRHLTIRRYWDMPLDTPLRRYRHEEEYLEECREILGVAVKDRLRTDRIVISMSGGLDSTSIAAVVRRERPDLNGGRISAFTTLYERVHPDEEKRYAELAAKHLELPIHYFPLDEFEMLKPYVAASEPDEDFTPASTIERRRQVASLGRVMLMGNGADTLFTYSPVSLLRLLSETHPLAVTPELLRQWRWNRPRRLRHLGRFAWGKRRRTNGKASAGYRSPRWLNPDFEAWLQPQERWRALSTWRPASSHPRHPEPHKWLIFLDWAFGDRGMPSSDFAPIERRDPFMDLRFIEFVFSLPPLPWCLDKSLLRKTMRMELPDEIVSRPKSILGPIHHSLLKRSDTEWMDRWVPTSDLTQYILREAIPPVGHGVCDPSESLTHLRPLILNLWLESQKNFRKCER